MTDLNTKVKVLGRRVLIRKERLDVGGLNVTPAMEDGMKNEGTIVSIGQIGFFKRLKLKKGTKVLFSKHFIPNQNEETENLTFVEVENIIAITN